MKNTCVNFMATLCLALLLGSCMGTSVQTVAFDTSIQEDATYEVFKCFMDGDQSKAMDITFEKGVYHFYPEKAYEQFCYISNHNDVLSRIGFMLKDRENITIDGNGATFIFHGRIIPFWMENSKNITIKNLTIDWAETFHSEGTIVAVNEKEKSFDMSISDEYPYEIRNDQLIFIKPYYQHTLGQSIMYDPATSAIAYQTEHYTPISTIGYGVKGVGQKSFDYKYKTDMADVYIRNRGAYSPLRTEQLKPGLVRVYGHRKKLPLPGMVLASKGEQGDNRLAPAFKSCNVTNLSFENVIVHHAGGMGFLFENCENVDMYKCQVVPSNGRMVSTTADATHFVGCRGKVALRDCIFRNQLDDATNVHGTYQEVMDIIDDYTVGLRVGHFQQLGFILARPGDTIGVVRLADSFHDYAKLTVKEVDVINGRYHRISFNEKLPEKIAANDLLENLSAYPEVLIENCDISRNRARGILLSTPKNTVIRNNYFSTEMVAILLPVESSSWYESGNATNVIIEGNTFQDCTAGGMNSGVIEFVTDDESDNMAFSNILIKGNTFNHFDNLILEVSNVEGLKFEENTITNSGTFPAQHPENAVVNIQYSKNIEFNNNNYQGKATRMVDCLKGMPEVAFK